ncbi:MAG: nucleotide sugar dehydrogenase, partial [Flavobacteriia bacterium]|nr:nucleotide sugar dehydrogenase [Flavobacteriia bacterium]
VAVNHREYAALDEAYFSSLMATEQGVFIDVKGLYKGKIHRLEYWSL